MMKRRDALKTIGGLGAAAGMARYLPGCGGGGDDAPGITTYVYMMMENRSYDHFFGARSMLEGKHGDGLAPTMTNPDLAGRLIAPFTPDKNSLCAIDPPHGWDAGRMQFNGGANDGFVKAHQMEHQSMTAIEPMQYLVRNDVSVSWALADQYATADRWFCAVMGPTWPNRFYWHAATSEGKMANTLPTMGLLTEPSIYQRLDAKGVDWGYYYGSIPVVSLYQGIDSSHIHRFGDFLVDAAAGKLPPVVYIDPAFNQNDDHPPVHPIHGQELIATVYTALAKSPQWKHCMLVITYDEHGGFFDHVPPPKTVDVRAAQGFDQLGFRVPTLVAGPYVKQSYVSSKVYEHCSALRELELAFDLEPLNARTMAANDLSDFIDMERLAKGDWAKPIEIPMVDPSDTSQWPMGAVCSSGTLREEHPVLEWANAHPDALGSLDLRPELPEYRRTIREFLASHATERVK
ncbi:MAG TPA: alkaline phosphatase family protein [Kofleriaceae bacterium]